MTRKNAKSTRKGEDPSQNTQVVDSAIMQGTNGKVPVRDFVFAAVKTLRKPGQKGIHVSWSGFNKIFVEYYGVPSRAYVDELWKKDFLDKVIASGGCWINIPSLPADVAPEPPKKADPPQMSPELKKVLDAAGVK